MAATGELRQVLGRAAALYRQGSYAEAERCCREVLGHHGDCFDALHLLGIIAARTRRTQEAAELFASAVAEKPDDAAVRNNYGNVLRHLKRFEEALASYDFAVRLQPNHAEAHNNRGNVLRDLGRHDDALASYERALAAKPGYAEAYYNRGLALHDAQRAAEALESYEQALQLRPDLAEIHNNRGNALRDLERFDEALASYARALQIDPQLAEAHLNRGMLFYEHARPELALACYNEAIRLRADFAAAYHNRAYASLLAGDFAGGWADHEWRWRNERAPLMKEKRAFAQPLWLGEQSLAGACILLHGEQGLGDTIQFCRYATAVAELGARVILEVPRALHDLARSLDGVAEVIVRGDPLPDFAYHCPLMSLPLAFRTTLHTIPARVPYLSAAARQARDWRERLGPRSKLRVGLVWSGGFRPRQLEVWSVNRRRNIPLSKLATLRHARVEFYSLQKGEPAESELKELGSRSWDGPQLIDFTGELHDFADTAALVENLDLVVSVDTSTAHLAGALGKPVWILNRFDTCWRWLLDRTDSPWYPTARLYRQEKPGDWDGVVDRVGADLARLAPALA